MLVRLLGFFCPFHQVTLVSLYRVFGSLLNIVLESACIRHCSVHIRAYQTGPNMLDQPAGNRNQTV